MSVALSSDADGRAVLRVGADMDHLTEAPGLGPFKYEAEFQRWLAEHPDRLESELWIVAGELELDPVERHRVDLLGVGADGRLVVVEVKRANATREAVGQVLDYVSALEEMDLDEIADLIETASPYGELLPVSDFGQQYADRFDGTALSMLTPARIMLASTAATPATERILRYLRNHDVDAEAHSFDGDMEGGKRVYRRKRSKPAPPREDSGSPDSTSPIADTWSVPEPCRSAAQQRQKRDSQRQRDVEEVHERSEDYPGVELFRSIHCLALDAFPEALEQARTKTDRKQQEQCGIALTMPSTPEDEESGRIEYIVIRLYPVGAGVIEIFVYNRAEWRAGDTAVRLDTLPERPLYLGKDRRVDVNGRNFWFTADTWPRHQANFEAVLHAIHEGWKAEREARV